MQRDIAVKLAYASRHVDDARVNHIELSGKLPDIKHDLIQGKPAFYDMATSHSYLLVKSFNYDLMINNTCTFHFVPGCFGNTFAKKMRCKADNTVINKILNEAKLEKDPIKFGVSLHPYADSFSHQGFSGLMSKVNDIQNIRLFSNYYKLLPFKILIIIHKLLRRDFDKYFDKVVPAYGHGQALSYPDLPYLKWSYDYDDSDEFSEDYQTTGLIYNPDRYFQAFSRMREHIESYLDYHPEYRDKSVNFTDFASLYALVVQREANITRRRNWRKLLVAKGLLAAKDPALWYDEFDWLKEAFPNISPKKFKQRSINKVELNSGFPQTNWYQFYQAVKWYKERFFKHCALEGLKIPR